MKARKRSGVTVLPYMAFLSPPFLITTLMLTLAYQVLAAEGTSRLEASLSRSEQVIWIAIVGVTYLFWAVRLVMRTHTRALIINSKSIYVRDDRRRFRLSEVYIARYIGPFALEHIVEIRAPFSLSTIFGPRRTFFALGFLGFFYVISDVVDSYRRRP
jgi:hypothetical protein